MHSRNKGKRGELEFAKLLTSEGFEARRGQQFSGGSDSPDVVCEALGKFHFEVKRVEALRLYPAMAQATNDAGLNKIPLVAHRRNGEEWVVITKASDFLKLLKTVQS